MADTAAATTVRESRSSRRADWAALVLFVVLTALAFSPDLLDMHRWLKDPGDPLLNAWILAWDTHALTTNPAGLFDANIFHPHPLTLAYSESLLGVAPLAAPVFLLTGNAVLAANVVLLVGFVLCGWCTYLLVTRLTGNPWAGVVAGALMTYSPVHVLHVSHLQLVSLQWLPVVLLFLDRLLTDGRWRDVGWLVLSFNLQFLSSYYLGLFMAVMVVLVLVGYLVCGLGRCTRRLVGQLVVFAVITAAINIPLARPYFQVAESMGFTRTMGDAVGFSATLRGYLTPDPAHPIYGAALHPGGASAPATMEHWVFLGFLPWALGLLALALRPPGSRQGRLIAVYALTTVGLFILSLGPEFAGLRIAGRPVPLPYALLYHYVPGFAGIRVVARLAMLVATSLAILAGLGVDQVLRRWPGRALVATVLLCGVALVEMGTPCAKGVYVPVGREVPEVYRWLARQPPGTVTLELPISGNALQQAFQDASRLYLSTYHWQPLVNGYSGFAPPLYREVVAASQDFPNAETMRWLRLLRVNYLILERGGYEIEDSWPEVERLLGPYRKELRQVAAFEEHVVLQVALPPLPTETVLGGKLRLIGYDVSPGLGNLTARVRLCWQPLRRLAATDRLRVGVVVGPSAALDDAAPRATDGRPPDQWRPLEIIVQEAEVPSFIGMETMGAKGLGVVAKLTEGGGAGAVERTLELGPVNPPR